MVFPNIFWRELGDGSGLLRRTPRFLNFAFLMDSTDVLGVTNGLRELEFSRIICL